MAEKSVGFSERTAPQNDLGPVVRDRIEGRKPLEQPHRIVGRQDRDGGAETDAFGLAGDGREQDFRRRNREIVAVVFAKAEDIDPDPIGQHPLGHDIAQHLVVPEEVAGRINGDIAESVEAELDGHDGGPVRRSGST